MNAEDFLPRAPRMPVRAPVVYRTSPAAAWSEGWTRDISRSGVLITLPNGSVPKGDLEFVIQLSRGALQGPGVALLPDLHCHGRIVRQAEGPEGESLIAACIRRQTIRDSSGEYDISPPGGGC